MSRPLASCDPAPWAGSQEANYFFLHGVSKIGDITHHACHCHVPSRGGGDSSGITCHWSAIVGEMCSSAFDLDFDTITTGIRIIFSAERYGVINSIVPKRSRQPVTAVAAAAEGDWYSYRTDQCDTGRTASCLCQHHHHHYHSISIAPITIRPWVHYAKHW